MVSVVDLVGLLVIVLANGTIAALLTRFFRVRLSTRLGSLLYALVLGPVVLTINTLVLSGVFRLGPDLGSPIAVVGIAIVAPLAVGVSFDYFWMPAPEDVDVPDTV